jgi:hypothetical protein
LYFTCDKSQFPLNLILCSFQNLSEEEKCTSPFPKLSKHDVDSPDDVEINENEALLVRAEKYPFRKKYAKYRTLNFTES